jgi:type II secretion system protein G
MHRRGFTLIELLVVISIIGLLSSIVLASIKDARLRAEYRATQQGFRSIANALELYRSENGFYPQANNLNGVELSTIRTTYLSKYISEVPKLPRELSDRPVKYVNNPYTSPSIRYEWNCGGDSYSNGYVIFMTGVSNPPAGMTNYFSKTLHIKRLIGAALTYVHQSDAYCLIDTVN